MSLSVDHSLRFFFIQFLQHNRAAFDRILFPAYFPSTSIAFSRHFGAAAGDRTVEERRSSGRKFQVDPTWKKPLVALAIMLLVIGQYVVAQNLGSTPQLNVAVQGQTGAQPEGTFLNFINWIGNVIAPVGAGGAVVGAVVSWLTGRGFGRWLFAAGVAVGSLWCHQAHRVLDHKRNRRCDLTDRP